MENKENPRNNLAKNNSIEEISNEQLIRFNYSIDDQKIIKVVGIGGAGGNAVRHMKEEGIDSVSYLAINTDIQDLGKVGEVERLAIGRTITQGYGAGDDPERARLAAEESKKEIEEALINDTPRIVFIVAGLGGGTGTGASPVVAKIARTHLDLLTIGIVTIPEIRAGRNKIMKALTALERLKQEVDAVLIINNEKVFSHHEDLSITQALYNADMTIVNAAKSIADLIHTQGEINVDTNDVIKTLKDGGISVIGSGEGNGENRFQEALNSAINSPLLNGNEIYRAGRLLVYFYTSHEHEASVRETRVIDNFTRTMDTSYDYINGHGFDDSLETKARVTILASGFDLEEMKNSLLQ